MPFVSLLKAEHAAPFLSFAATHGIAEGPLLRRCGLPSCMTERSDFYVPERLVWAMTNVLAADTGVTDVGLRSGRNIDIAEFGELASQLGSAVTTHDLLQRFLAAVRRESSGANFWVTRTEDSFWFCRGAVPSIDVSQDQVEQYISRFMIQVVRLALGATWQPRVVQLMARGALPQSVLGDAFGHAEIRFGASCTAIDVTFAEAAQLVPENERRRLREARIGFSSWGGADTDIAFVRALELALEGYITGEAPSLALAARICDCSPRTLQRRLQEAGVDFRTVLDRVRFARAAYRLRNNTVRVAHVAEELGYSDAAHFTRAFRRWAGVSPRQFRAAQTS